MKKIIFITFFILLLDQASKIYIKTNFAVNQKFSVMGDWFLLTLVENPGMAYGVQFGGLFGKYLLVILRIVLIVWMIFLFKKWIKEKASNYLLIPMAMIFAGAIGNLIDGMFYGLVFDTGTTYDEVSGRWFGYSGVSQWVGFSGEGYASLMKGCVVDMFLFPIIDWEVPNDFPIIGGKHIEFFKYVFNIADSAISVGGVLLFLFRKKAFPNGF